MAMPWWWWWWLCLCLWKAQPLCQQERQVVHGQIALDQENLSEQGQISLPGPLCPQEELCRLQGPRCPQETPQLLQGPLCLEETPEQLQGALRVQETCRRLQGPLRVQSQLCVQGPLCQPQGSLCVECQESCRWVEDHDRWRCSFGCSSQKQVSWKNRRQDCCVQAGRCCRWEREEEATDQLLRCLRQGSAGQQEDQQGLFVWFGMSLSFWLTRSPSLPLVIIDNAQDKTAWHSFFLNSVSRDHAGTLLCDLFFLPTHNHARTEINTQKFIVLKQIKITAHCLYNRVQKDARRR